jgi:large conductance mechanosensitive channel
MLVGAAGGAIGVAHFAVLAQNGLFFGLIPAGVAALGLLLGFIACFGKKEKKEEAPKAAAAPVEEPKEEAEEEATTKKCPHCCEEVNINATKCPHCTGDIPAEE